MVKANYIAFFLTTHCSLNCKLCSFAVPYHNKRSHEPLDKLTEQFRRVFELCDIVKHVDLVGGEPLLHPNFSDILRELRNYSDKFDEIRVLTNCTVVPNEDILRLTSDIKISGKNFLFCLDNYGELSTRFDEIRAKLEIYEIPYMVMDYSGNNQAYGGWVDYEFGKPPYNRDYSERQLQDVFEACAYRSGAWEVFQGKIFPCVFLQSHEMLGNKIVGGNDFVDVFDDSICISEKKKILKGFVERTTPYNGCGKCPGLGKYAKRYGAAEQI